MPLHTRIAPDDCIEQYEKAAKERQEVGDDLLKNGSALGIEMMAPSTEMVLKAAYFRSVGYDSARRMEMADLRDAETDIRNNLSVSTVAHPTQSFHNLAFWAEGVITLHQAGLPTRSRGGRTYAAVPPQPLMAVDESILRQCTARLMENWAIGDRYKSLVPHASEQELKDVLDDATTIINLYDQGSI